MSVYTMTWICIGGDIIRLIGGYSGANTGMITPRLLVADAWAKL